MPEDAPPSLVELCVQCCGYEAEDRPDAFAVQDWLSSLSTEFPEERDPDLVELLDIIVEGACCIVVSVVLCCYACACCCACSCASCCTSCCVCCCYVLPCVLLFVLLCVLLCVLFCVLLCVFVHVFLADPHPISRSNMSAVLVAPSLPPFLGRPCRHAS